MNKKIIVGTPVAFDSEHGPQTGTVSAITQDISNGQSVALICVDGVYSDTPWKMPINALRIERVALSQSQTRVRGSHAI